jgi:hypothetical protein
MGVYCAIRTAVAAVRLGRALAAMTLPWFGHLRYGATPFVHSDDHRDLARQAVSHLVRRKVASRSSDLAEHRRVVERSCGLLDIMETELGGKVYGKLQWDYSHMYDPLAGRGIADKTIVNALEEYRDYWERALLHYRIDNHHKAFAFLGYCCHLLQDMAVPSHTFCIAHGLKTRTADNLELVSTSRRFYLRGPAGGPYPGEEDAHVGLFVAMGLDSRGREPFDSEDGNDIAGILQRYYEAPKWRKDGWQGRYIGDFYYPYHRLLPSSPRIRLDDLVTLRNCLMSRAAERTAQLVWHFCELTGAGE